MNWKHKYTTKDAHFLWWTTNTLIISTCIIIIAFTKRSCSFSYIAIYKYVITAIAIIVNYKSADRQANHQMPYAWMYNLIVINFYRDYAVISKFLKVVFEVLWLTATTLARHFSFEIIIISHKYSYSNSGVPNVCLAICWTLKTVRLCQF